MSSGSVIRAHPSVGHRSRDIEEELRLLVFFAPPEASLGATVN